MAAEKNKKNKKNRKVLMRLLTVLLTFVLIGVLSVSVVGVYVFYNVNRIVGGDELMNLNDYMMNQSQTTIVYTLDKEGNEVVLSHLHGEINRIWVESNEIPLHLKEAFVALEDKRFEDHPGVDWKRTLKAFLLILSPASEDTEGGSTITQQLIKNLTGDNSVTFIRKFNEILRALNMTRYFSRDTILTTYLNTLYLDEGCYGVQTASEYYFGKSVQDINIAESACLAAITKAPRTYNPLVNYDKNRNRQLHCLSLMFEQGKISEEEYEEAKEYELVFRTSEDFVPMEDDEQEQEQEKKEEKEIQSYYVDYIIDQVIDHFQIEYGYTKAEAWQKVYYGGLKIHAAVDLELQSIMEDVYYNRKQFPKEQDTVQNPAVQSAMSVVDYQGRLLGIVGQAGPKTANRVLNIAAHSPRQPGSSIKPMSVYAPGINEKTIHWSSKFQNYGFNLNGKIWPKNYSGPGNPNHYVTVAAALPPSLNTIPAQILKKGNVSLQTGFDYLQNAFHVSTLHPNDSNYSPLAVGGMEYGVTTLDMAAAFATFGNGGKYYEPYSYYTVSNYLGNQVLLAKDDVGEQVLEPAAAEVMLELLKNVVTGSGSTVGGNYVNGFRDKMFAKTGTTDDNYDQWFVGGTPYAVCAVWYGYKTPKSIPSIGYNPPGRLFKTVLDEYHKDLDRSQDFPFEAGNAVQRRYCTGSGNIASSSCAGTAWGWYRYDYIPSTCVNCGAYGDSEDIRDTSGSGEGSTGDRTTTDGTTDDTTGTTREPTTRIPTTEEPTVVITVRPSVTQREDEVTRRPEE